MEDIDDIVAGWITFNGSEEHEKGENSEYFKYWISLSDLIENCNELALEAILKIVKQDNSDTILANLAAGPLEDLLRYADERTLQAIERAAKSDAYVRKALGAVWKGGIPEKTWERIKLVSGPSF